MISFWPSNCSSVGPGNRLVILSTDHFKKVLSSRSALGRNRPPYAKLFPVIVLAVDTCDSRGSVAVVEDPSVRGLRLHPTDEDYSSWLLPATAAVLQEAGLAHARVDVYAVAVGPGSFTGLRVGLTTVKAWAEVYRKPIVGISRLLALACQCEGNAPFVAAYADAHRGQLFAALFRRTPEGLVRVEDEMVIAPSGFAQFVRERTEQHQVDWISLDPGCLAADERYPEGGGSAAPVQAASPVLAPDIAKLAFAAAREHRFLDPLTLDANYVRRSDAEVFWKGGAGPAGKSQ